ncbi:class I SAM-dependent methyltransferase [Streptomyces sp. NPDC021020]|uniref:class I SAM-dependent methyltransferase n=1 Tax=Streptomyces sp. NPDC021020 TaxID=3365109 RepID=UPI0037B0F9F8
MSPHTDPGHGAGHAHSPSGQGHAHGHGHGHDTEIDWEEMSDHLIAAGELQLPVLRDVAARLHALLDGDGEAPAHEVRRVLDVGSGPGVMTCVFAEELGAAEAVAVDGSQPLLDRALTRAAALGLQGRIGVRAAELNGGLPADLGPADLVWSSKAVHHLGDQQGALDALAAVLRPGGLLAVAEGGLPVRFLPRDIGRGTPGLTARLDAVGEEWFDAMRAELPGSKSVVEDWPGMLRTAGLTGVTSFTCLLDLPAPLTPAGRDYLLAFLTRIREKVGGELLSPADRETLAVLTDPDAPESILHRPDAYLLMGITVHVGRRPS